MSRPSASFLALALVLPLAATGAPAKSPPAKAAPAKAAPAKAAARPAPAPLPLLDRELFFSNPELAGAQLSPDGKWVAFLKPWRGTLNVWVKRLEEPYQQAHLVTADPRRPIPAFFWSRDSTYLLFVQDQDGDENYNVSAVDPSAAPAEGQEAPLARALTAARGAQAVIHELPKKDPDLLYVGLNDRDPAWHDLYRVRLSTGERTLVRQNTERISGWVFDLEGALRVAVRSTEQGDTELLRVDPQGLAPIIRCGVLETCRPVRMHKDGKRLYLVTNRGKADLSRLVLLDLATGKEALVESDPRKAVDFGQALFSEATDELVGAVYVADRLRYQLRNPRVAADHALLARRLPGKDLTVSSASADDRLWLVDAVADTDPGSTYLLDRKTKALTLQYQLQEKLPRAQLAPVKPFTYRSSDGLTIPAYLTLPKGVPARKLPLLVLPHGGPWARDQWGFDGTAQFFANRGYAVLQPNFRGSTGYGKRFLDAGNRQWGQKMQDDLTWGVKALVKQGVADPRRVGIAGASYGGYAALAGAAFTPDLYAAAVDVVGPSSLLTLLETIPPYWEADRALFRARLGDPGTAEGKAQLQRQSPLEAADRIKAPLLVVQGANDPRVKKAESEQIVTALRDRGAPVQYLLAPDEGHGFQRPVNVLALFAAAEAFLARHLQGRAQEGGSPEVVARVQALTVDVATVGLLAAAPSEPGPAGALRPGSDLEAATVRYQGAIVAGAQTVPISIQRVTQEAAGGWSVTETLRTPQGEAVDQATLEKGTLQPLRRTLTQGPTTIELRFEGARASGTQTANGEARPFTVDLGEPLFADGPGNDDVLARLPLAGGYQATFWNLDARTRKPTRRQLTVLGAEQVTVAAGTFQTWRAQVRSADGEPGELTLWVAQGSRRVVKLGATLPELGGAVLTAELQP